MIGFGATPAGGAPLVLMRVDKGARVVPIAVGPLELFAIASPLEGIEPPRPLTHDLLASVLDAIDTEVVQVEIAELRDGAYHAGITLATKEGEIELDARPSDAIALAIRTNAPIFASDQVVEEGSVEFQAPASEDDIVEEFRGFLDEVNPSDFGDGGSGDDAERRS